MNAGIKMVISITILLPAIVIFSSYTHKRIGVVTVDGEQIPPEFFQTLALLDTKHGCSPKSGDRIREIVVMSWLLVREGTQQGVDFIGADKYGVEDATEEFDRLPNDAPEDVRMIARWKLQEELGNSYRNALVGEIDDVTTMNRYRQAIKEGDPRLVNLTLLKRTDYNLANEAARDEVRKMIESGRSIKELERENLLGTFDPYQSEEWEAIGFYDLLDFDQAAELSPGDIIYSEKFGKQGIVVIHDTKILSRVRPYHPINGDDYYARRTANTLVRNEKRVELEASLRDAAQVKEDNVLVEASPLNPTCDR